MKTLLTITLMILGISTAYAQDLEATTMQPSSSNTEKNQRNAESFLSSNAKKPGVVTLGNGLQYKILNNGNGNKPTANDVVVVDYAGTLVDGTEFDSSYKRGQPATFPVSAVIPGWTQALQMMNEGSTWMLYLPPTLAYGDRGAPPAIGPNEALIFKVHLIEVKK